MYYSPQKVHTRIDLVAEESQMDQVMGLQSGVEKLDRLIRKVIEQKALHMAHSTACIQKFFGSCSWQCHRLLVLIKQIFNSGIQFEHCQNLAMHSNVMVVVL